MMNCAVLLRELRRLLHSPTLWVLVVMSGLSGSVDPMSPDQRGATPVVLAALFAAYWAQRSMNAEIEGDTLEQLGTLPLSVRAVTFQVGSGAALAALTYAAVAFTIATLPRASDQLVESFAYFLRFAPCVFAMGWMSALGSFRYGDSWWMNWLLMIPSTVALAIGCVVVGAALAIPSLPLSIAASTFASWVLFEGSLRFWEYCGGQWVESMLPLPPPRSARVAPVAVAEAGETVVPDGVSPLLWYDCKPARWTTAALALLPSAAVVLAVLRATDAPDIRGLLEFLLGTAAFLGSVVLGMVVAGRTAAIRESGMWADVAVTPLSAHTVVLGHVGGPLLRAYACLAVWVGTLLVLGRFDVRGDAVALFGVVVVGWALCAFSAFLAGALTNGWKAGMLALAIAQLALFGIGCFIAVMIPSCGPASGAQFLAVLALAIATAFLVLYLLCESAVRRSC